MTKRTILVTGGDGRFAQELKKHQSNYNLIFRNKKQLNICLSSSIKSNIKKYKPNYIIHLAGLSRPMKIHKNNIEKSIELNIIGTCNLVKECARKNIKIIYFSTNYIYQGLKGNYKESEPLLPWNNYGWSKLGGESAVQMYQNSLILRCAMTEYPFKHNKAFSDVKNNFIYHKDLVPILFKLISKRGVYNVGGRTQSVFNFVKKDKPKIKKEKSKGIMPKRLDMNLKKLSLVLKK